MTTLAATAFVLFLIQGALGTEEQPKKTVINVDIYYESLCPDSMGFVATQLAPAYENLQNHLKIDFIPYGKASHHRDENTGRWIFSCQHGSRECEGNRRQACALDAIEKTETENTQRLSAKLVICVMSSSYPSNAVTGCAEKVGLSDAAKTHIAECQGSTTGDDLLVAHGERTSKIEPRITFIPTIIINGENRSDALSNFRGIVCGLLTQDEKPSSCASA